MSRHATDRLRNAIRKLADAAAQPQIECNAVHGHIIAEPDGEIKEAWEALEELEYPDPFDLRDMPITTTCSVHLTGRGVGHISVKRVKNTLYIEFGPWCSVFVDDIHLHELERVCREFSEREEVQSDVAA